MNDHKLYSVIGGGFRNIVKAALISRLYPYVGSDTVTANILTIVSASIQDAIIDEVVESVNISNLGIINGNLSTVLIPFNYQEFITTSGLSIISAQLQKIVVSPENPTTDIVSISPLAMVGGELKEVVVPIESSIETINISNLSIISGSLV